MYLTPKDKPALTAVALTAGAIVTFTFRKLGQEGLESVLPFALFAALFVAASALGVAHRLSTFFPALKKATNLVAWTTSAIAGAMCVLNADALMAERQPPSLEVREATRILCPGFPGEPDTPRSSGQLCFRWTPAAADGILYVNVFPQVGHSEPEVGELVQLEARWHPSLLWGPRSYHKERQIVRSSKPAQLPSPQASSAAGPSLSVPAASVQPD